MSFWGKGHKSRNFDEKNRYKMYKDGKKWVFAGITTLAGVLGGQSIAGSARADETTASNGSTVSSLVGDKDVLATQDSAVIPAQSETNSSAVSSSTASSSTKASSVSTKEAQQSQSSSASTQSKAGSVASQASEKKTTSSSSVAGNSTADTSAASALSTLASANVSVKNNIATSTGDSLSNNENVLFSASSASESSNSVTQSVASVTSASSSATQSVSTNEQSNFATLQANLPEGFTAILNGSQIVVSGSSDENVDSVKKLLTQYGLAQYASIQLVDPATTATPQQTAATAIQSLPAGMDITTSGTTLTLHLPYKWTDPNNILTVGTYDANSAVGKMFGGFFTSISIQPTYSWIIAPSAINTSAAGYAGAMMDMQFSSIMDWEAMLNTPQNWRGTVTPGGSTAYASSAVPHDSPDYLSTIYWVSVAFKDYVKQIAQGVPAFFNNNPTAVAQLANYNPTVNPTQNKFDTGWITFTKDDASNWAGNSNDTSMVANSANWTSTLWGTSSPFIPNATVLADMKNLPTAMVQVVGSFAALVGFSSFSSSALSTFTNFLQGGTASSYYGQENFSGLSNTIAIIKNVTQNGLVNGVLYPSILTMDTNNIKFTDNGLILNKPIDTTNATSFDAGLKNYYGLPASIAGALFFDANVSAYNQNWLKNSPFAGSYSQAGKQVTLGQVATGSDGNTLINPLTGNPIGGVNYNEHVTVLGFNVTNIPGAAGTSLTLPKGAVNITFDADTEGIYQELVSLIVQSLIPQYNQGLQDAISDMQKGVAFKLTSSVWTTQTGTTKAYDAGYAAAMTWLSAYQKQALADAVAGVSNRTNNTTTNTGAIDAIQGSLPYSTLDAAGNYTSTGTTTTAQIANIESDPSLVSLINGVYNAAYNSAKDAIKDFSNKGLNALDATDNFNGTIASVNNSMPSTSSTEADQGAYSRVWSLLVGLTTGDHNSNSNSLVAKSNLVQGAAQAAVSSAMANKATGYNVAPFDLTKVTLPSATTTAINGTRKSGAVTQGNMSGLLTTLQSVQQNAYQNESNLITKAVSAGRRQLVISNQTQQNFIVSGITVSADSTSYSDGTYTYTTSNDGTWPTTDNSGTNWQVSTDRSTGTGQFYSAGYSYEAAKTASFGVTYKSELPLTNTNLYLSSADIATLAGVTQWVNSNYFINDTDSVVSDLVNPIKSVPVYTPTVNGFTPTAVPTTVDTTATNPTAVVTYAPNQINVTASYYVQNPDGSITATGKTATVVLNYGANSVNNVSDVTSDVNISGNITAPNVYGHYRLGSDNSTLDKPIVLTTANYSQGITVLMGTKATYNVYVYNADGKLIETDVGQSGLVGDQVLNTGILANLLSTAQGKASVLHAYYQNGDLSNLNINNLPSGISDALTNTNAILNDVTGDSIAIVRNLSQQVTLSDSGINGSEHPKFSYTINGGASLQGEYGTAINAQQGDVVTFVPDQVPGYTFTGDSNIIVGTSSYTGNVIYTPTAQSFHVNYYAIDKNGAKSLLGTQTVSGVTDGQYTITNYGSIPTGYSITADSAKLVTGGSFGATNPDVEIDYKIDSAPVSVTFVTEHGNVSVSGTVANNAIYYGDGYNTLFNQNGSGQIVSDGIHQITGIYLATDTTHTNNLLGITPNDSFIKSMQAGIALIATVSWPVSIPVTVNVLGKSNNKPKVVIGTNNQVLGYEYGDSAKITIPTVTGYTAVVTDQNNQVLTQTDGVVSYVIPNTIANLTVTYTPNAESVNIVYVNAHGQTLNGINTNYSNQNISDAEFGQSVASLLNQQISMNVVQSIVDSNGNTINLTDSLSGDASYKITLNVPAYDYVNVKVSGKTGANYTAEIVASGAAIISSSLASAASEEASYAASVAGITDNTIKNSTAVAPTWQNTGAAQLSEAASVASSAAVAASTANSIASSAAVAAYQANLAGNNSAASSVASVAISAADEAINDNALASYANSTAQSLASSLIPSGYKGPDFSYTLNGGNSETLNGNGVVQDAQLGDIVVIQQTNNNFVINSVQPQPIAKTQAVMKARMMALAATPAVTSADITVGGNGDGSTINVDPVDVSVVINYQTSDGTIIQSSQTYTDFYGEIYNGSDDGALATADGKYVLIQNPDSGNIMMDQSMNPLTFVYAVNPNSVATSAGNVATGASSAANSAMVVDSAASSVATSNDASIARAASYSSQSSLIASAVSNATSYNNEAKSAVSAAMSASTSASVAVSNENETAVAVSSAMSAASGFASAGNSVAAVSAQSLANSLASVASSYALVANSYASAASSSAMLASSAADTAAKAVAAVAAITAEITFTTVVRNGSTVIPVLNANIGTAVVGSDLMNGGIAGLALLKINSDKTISIGGIKLVGSYINGIYLSTDTTFSNNLLPTNSSSLIVPTSWSTSPVSLVIDISVPVNIGVISDTDSSLISGAFPHGISGQFGSGSTVISIPNKPGYTPSVHSSGNMGGKYFWMTTDDEGTIVAVNAGTDDYPLTFDAASNSWKFNFTYPLFGSDEASALIASNLFTAYGDLVVDYTANAETLNVSQTGAPSGTQFTYTVNGGATTSGVYGTAVNANYDDTVVITPGTVDGYSISVSGAVDNGNGTYTIKLADANSVQVKYTNIAESTSTSTSISGSMSTSTSESSRLSTSTSDSSSLSTSTSGSSSMSTSTSDSSSLSTSTSDSSSLSTSTSDSSSLSTSTSDSSSLSTSTSDSSSLSTSTSDSSSLSTSTSDSSSLSTSTSDSSSLSTSTSDSSSLSTSTSDSSSLSTSTSDSSSLSTSTSDSSSLSTSTSDSSSLSTSTSDSSSLSTSTSDSSSLSTSTSDSSSLSTSTSDSSSLSTSTSDSSSLSTSTSDSSSLSTSTSDSSSLSTSTSDSSSLSTSTSDSSSLSTSTSDSSSLSTSTSDSSSLSTSTSDSSSLSTSTSDSSSLSTSTSDSSSLSTSTSDSSSLSTSTSDSSSLSTSTSDSSSLSTSTSDSSSLSTSTSDSSSLSTSTSDSSSLSTSTSDSSSLSTSTSDSSSLSTSTSDSSSLSTSTSDSSSLSTSTSDSSSLSTSTSDSSSLSTSTSDSSSLSTSTSDSSSLSTSTSDSSSLSTSTSDSSSLSTSTSDSSSISTSTSDSSSLSTSTSDSSSLSTSTSDNSSLSTSTSDSGSSSTSASNSNSWSISENNSISNSNIQSESLRASNYSSNSGMSNLAVKRGNEFKVTLLENDKQTRKTVQTGHKNSNANGIKSQLPQVNESVGSTWQGVIGLDVLIAIALILKRRKEKNDGPKR